MSDCKAMSPDELVQEACDAWEACWLHDEDAEGETSLDDTHPLYHRSGAVSVELSRRLHKLAAIEGMDHAGAARWQRKLMSWLDPEHVVWLEACRAAADILDRIGRD